MNRNANIVAVVGTVAMTAALALIDAAGYWFVVEWIGGFFVAAALLSPFDFLRSPHG